MKRCKLFTLGLIVAAAAAVGGFFTYATRACPSVGALRAYTPPEASRVYAADGSFIADLSPQRRTVVELHEVPALVREGFVAVEDRRFWEHPGVDPRGVVRAVWRDLTTLSLREGFSTITMQLARNVFPEALPRTAMLGRKACEVYLAPQIEAAFGKREVLELYLNQIYLGSGLYGVAAAAEGYFDEPLERIGPAEAALLIGLVKSPEGYNPRKHPSRAVRRRNIVLDVMAREGVISARTAEEAKAEPLRVEPPPEAETSAPYYVAAVRRELKDRFGSGADTRGLRVYTGLDPSLQQAAREALTAQLRRIEEGRYGRYPHPTGEDEPRLQGSVVVLDPETGAVRALVGGRDFAESQFDRALQARRQPGSAFKPIVYAAALDAGLPVTARIETTPVVVRDGSGPWRPGDHVADSVEALPLRTALATSSNHAAVRLGRWVGEERVIETGRALGLTTPIPDYPSIHLGAAEVVPAELVAAYAAFGNGGHRVRPYLVTRVEDDDGRVLWEAEARRPQVLDPGVAYLTLDLMRGVVDHGTGSVVRTAGFHLPAAGKTGTTNDNKDSWFVGLTPDLAAGVWIGFDRPVQIMPGASGGRLAAPVWADLMNRAYRTRPAPREWWPPRSLLRVAVDTTTGAVATGDCPEQDVVIEHFLPGTEPREYCPTHPESGVERFFDRVWKGVKGVF